MNWRWYRLPILLLCVSLISTTYASNETDQTTTQTTSSSSSDTVQTVEKYIDVNWILDSAYLIFFMQAGFGMLEAGLVRAKNTKNILLKNLLDTAIGALCFWALGYGFAFGRTKGSANPFIGTGDFMLLESADYSMWMIQWAYASTATVIVHGPMAERSRFLPYIFYSVWLSLFVYPITAHWMWSPDGWLYQLGVLDAAGASVIHVLAGVAGLIGAALLGPRLGRFDQQTGEARHLPGHNLTFSALGMFILWYTWYGYTGGSTMGFSQLRWQTATRASINTTLAASIGLITVLVIRRIQKGSYDLVYCIHGLLAGLVSITACCSVIEPWAAVVIGFTASGVFIAGSQLLVKLKIDDPLDASPIHLGCGALSMLATGFFATEDSVAIVYPDRLKLHGIFYGGSGLLLGVQALAVVAVCAFSAVMSGALFYLLKRLHKLRVDPDTELAGLDNKEHGGSAYFP